MYYALAFQKNKIKKRLECARAVSWVLGLIQY